MDEKTLFVGRVFEVNAETWTSNVENLPGASANSTDVRCVILTFRKDQESKTRTLKLCLSHTLLNDPTKPYLRDIDWRIREWLAGPEEPRRIEVF